jgi:autotransporter-associated beta strand protein
MGTLNINKATALGTGTLTISGGTIDNTSAGDITLSNNNPQSWGASFTYTGGTRSLNMGTGAVTLTASPTVTVSGNTLIVGGAIGGAYAITKAGAGTLTLSGNNTFTDGTNGVTLNAGTLNINSATALGGATGKFTISSGTIDNTSAGDITLSNNNPQSWGASFTYTGGSRSLGMGAGAVTLTTSPTVTVSGNTLIVGGAIGGAYAITKAGAGTLTLSGNNTFTDGTNGVTLSAGTLNINSATALGGATGKFTINGGTIDNTSAGDITLSNNNPQSWGASFIYTGGSRSLNMGTGAVTLTTSPTVTVNGNTLIVGGAISGSYSLTKAGSGTLALSSTGNAWTGSTTISAGTLKLGASNVIPDASSVSVTGTFDLNGNSETIDGLSGAGTVDGTSGLPTLTVGSNNASSDFSGVLKNTAGNLALTKTGSGTLTLSKTTGNSYSGGTTVSAGMLLVTNTSGSGTGSGAANVNAGTLAGTGTISGLVTVANDATIQPGNSSAGTLTLGNGLVLNGTSILDYDVGTSTDQIAVTGNLTLDGSINITGGAGFGLGTKTILTYTGTLADNGLAIGSTPGGNYNYTIDVATTGQVKLIIKWSVSSLGAINGGAITGSAIYVGTGTPNNLYSRSLTDGSQNWAFPSTHGACRQPTYSYIGTSYKVFAATTDYFIALQDNGGGYATISGWPGREISCTGAGTPYVSTNNSYLYVPCSNGNLTQINMADGTVYKTASVSGLNTSADMVAASDYVYVATNNGYISRHDAGDVTTLNTFGPIGGGQSIDLPLLMSGRGTTLYVTPNNGTITALNVPAMTEKWTPASLTYSQSGGNTGASFVFKNRDTIYTAAGNYVYKIADGGGSASEKWYFTAPSSVNSGPLWWGGSVYFGCSNGSYYAIKDADKSIRTNWPRSIGSGDASGGPWIDLTNSQIIFGTTGGNLDAFTLEP